MNKKKNYKKGTRLDIIKTLHIGAVIPAKGLIIMDTPRTYKDKLHEMIKEGLIEESRVKCGRLTYRIFTLKDYEKNKQIYIDNLPDGYYESYIMQNQIIARKCRSAKGAASTRIITTAETYMIMRNAGVNCDPDNRPSLYGNEKIDINDNLYYSSTEIKEYTGYSDTVKIETEDKAGITGTVKSVISSRITGLLLSKSGCYSVYHLGHDLSYWQRGSELKMKVYIEGMLWDKTNYENNLSSSILFVEDYASFYKVINPFADKRSKGENSYQVLKAAYSSLYALPYSKAGRKMLEIMCTKNWIDNTKRMLLDGFSTNIDGVSPIDATKDGNDVCLFCIPDLDHFQRFINYETAYKKRPITICFDFQKEMVARCCKSLGSIMIVRFDLFYDRYMHIYGDDQ